MDYKRIREGLKYLEGSSTEEIMRRKLVLMAKTRKEFDKAIGPVQFALSYREKSIVTGSC